MAGFLDIPEGHVTLANLTLPGCLAGTEGDLIRRDISISQGRIVEDEGHRIDMGGALAFPCFTDMHTHLDKGHIWPRAANPDGTFMGAITTVADDRKRNWGPGDVAARMDFALRCAFAHGTAVIRTHIDSLSPQDRISWPIFAQVREAWADRITLQAASLIGCDSYEDIARDYAATADLVAEHDGVLGMVTYPVPDVERRIRDLFDLAGSRDLEVDFHVDETMDPRAETLRIISDVVLDIGWDRPVAVGHCCSLSAQDESRAMDTLDRVAAAGLNVVSLPLCNLYLQDRRTGRTPRMRGVTLVHEMKRRGINVSFASDNTRDPFYAYGDLDMIEVMRQATRIAHLDHSERDWIKAFTSNPRQAMSLDKPAFSSGDPADLVITKARNWTELFARPQSDRIVIRKGRAIDTALPDYAELDPLMEA